MDDKQHAVINEPQFLVDLVFKPIAPSLKLRPEETQLLLAYIGEILKEIEEEERQIIEKEKSSKGACNTETGVP